MARLVALVIFAGILVSCSGSNPGDYIPVWAGGLPKNVPPRPGSPEYDAYRKNLEAEAARDKSNDPPTQPPGGPTLVNPPPR
jgi:hypothetical protein